MCFDVDILRKNKAAVNLKTGRFDNINSAVIISSVCKAVQNLQYKTYFSSLSYFRPIFIVFRC